VAVQSIAAEIHAAENKDEEVDHDQYCCWIEGSVTRADPAAVREMNAAILAKPVSFHQPRPVEISRPIANQFLRAVVSSGIIWLAEVAYKTNRHY
jgi:hypothetical protein